MATVTVLQAPSADSGYTSRVQWARLQWGLAPKERTAYLLVVTWGHGNHSGALQEGEHVLQLLNTIGAIASGLRLLPSPLQR